MRSSSFRRSEPRQRLIKGTPLRAVSIHDGQLTGQRTYEIGQGFPKHAFSSSRSLIHQLSCQAACHWCYYQGWCRYANRQHTQHRQQWLHTRQNDISRTESYSARESRRCSIVVFDISNQLRSRHSCPSLDPTSVLLN
jgi:hypothetical protein